MSALSDALIDYMARRSPSGELYSLLRSAVVELSRRQEPTEQDQSEGEPIDDQGVEDAWRAWRAHASKPFGSRANFRAGAEWARSASGAVKEAT